MNIKNLLLKTREWLRRIVTAFRDTQSVYVNDNDDDNLGTIKGEASLSTKRSSLIDSLMLRMEEFIDVHYEVRYNRLSQQYELTKRGLKQWSRLDDELCCRLLMEMNREGIAIAKPYLVRTVVHGGELAKSYHPVHSYLESLPEWDGTKRIEPLFRRVTDDDQLLAWLRKWFIAMVAQVIGRMGTYGNSVCPILISHKQGWGKSQFAKMLIPPTLKTFYSDTFNLAQEEACLRRMTAYMLINVDEVDRFRDSRMPTFKNMVQMATVSMKRAYRSQMEEKERMASFIATSNRRYLLCDEASCWRFPAARATCCATRQVAAASSAWNLHIPSMWTPPSTTPNSMPKQWLHWKVVSVAGLTKRRHTNLKCTTAPTPLVAVYGTCCDSISRYARYPKHPMKNQSTYGRPQKYTTTCTRYLPMPWRVSTVTTSATI